MNIQEAEYLLLNDCFQKYEENIDDIEKAEQILFGDEYDDDVLKAVAQIGETRKWANGIYKKVEAGKWVKVTNGKEKVVSSSTMIKKIKQSNEKNQAKWLAIRREFEKTLTCPYPRRTKEYQSFFEVAWSDKMAQNEFVQRLKKEQEDIRDEIREIEKIIEIDKRKKRELRVGKKKIDISDINNISHPFREAKELFNKVDEKVPMFISPKELMPVVTIENYYLDTETTFKSILTGEEESKTIAQRWDDMKESKKYKHHQSPKSNSEYLINKETGDIYRYSDHWGRVASCIWDIETNSNHTWDIAKSNIKDFKRKDFGACFNPRYRIKKVEAAKLVLPQLKKLVSENKDYYLTDRAEKEVLNFAENIFRDLQYSVNLTVEEIEKLKKKYWFI